MVERFEDYISKYFGDQSDVFKGYLLAALRSKNRTLCYLDESLGDTIPSQDIRNCELLTGAGIFREEIKLTRNGRNLYKLFQLTQIGLELAEQVDDEGYDGRIPESVQMAF